MENWGIFGEKDCKENLILERNDNNGFHDEGRCGRERKHSIDKYQTCNLRNGLM